IVLPAEHVSGDLLESYHTLCEPVLEAFDRMDIGASFSEEPRDGIYEPACYLRPIHPAHDIIVGGAKISGNAQYRQRDVVIQHGSITYESDPSRHLACFDDHGIDTATFTERVTDVRSHSSLTRADTVAAIEGALAEWVDATEGEWLGSELRDARELAELKYRSVSWNRDGDDPTK
ncbi:MAG: biotin/lipoate A/B protein ligase family protein, partial [Halobacteriaceae archaeon]